MSLNVQIEQLDDLRSHIADAIEKRFGTAKEALLSNTPFLDLEFDSLILVEMQLLLEDEFGIQFEDEGALPKNLEELTSLVRRSIALQKL